MLTDRSLRCQVSGEVTYNGHTMNEFVPQKTSAYISQHDLHVAEMTVKETLEYSAKSQGIGTRYGTKTSDFQTSHVTSFVKFVHALDELF